MGIIWQAGNTMLAELRRLTVTSVLVSTMRLVSNIRVTSSIRLVSIVEGVDGMWYTDHVRVNLVGVVLTFSSPSLEVWLGLLVSGSADVARFSCRGWSIGTGGST
jgi:hypothetical protein